MSTSSAALQGPDLADVPAAAPRLRRIPTPQCEPPYEAGTAEPADPRRDGRTGPDGSTPPRQGTLALAFSLPGGLPAQPAHAPRPGGRPALRLVSSAAPSQAGRDEDEDEGPAPTPSSQLPDPTGWSRRLTQAVLEVLTGDRPAAQLVRWTTADVLAGITAQAARSRTTAGPGRAGHRRPLVRSVRVSEVDDGVAEVSAVVLRGGRAGALALRLEGRDGRWQCTALEAG